MVVSIRDAQRQRNHACSSLFAPTPREISFLHPALREGQNILCTLLGFDSQEGGLHHGTARIACAIIAGNRWDGYLSLQPNGSRIPETDDDVLLSDKYYFLVPGELSKLYGPSRIQREHVCTDSWAL